MEEQFQASLLQLVRDRDWETIYQISSYLDQEVSILIDAEDVIFIDWGDQSRVHLSPPNGSKIPFKLWVHTHPNMTAYWSGTDRESLSIATGILQCAYVLGGDGLLFTNSNSSEIADNLEGLDWTKELVIPWTEVRGASI